MLMLLLLLNGFSWGNAALVAIFFLMQCIELKDPFFMEWPIQDLEMDDPDNQSKFLKLLQELFEIRDNSVARSPVSL